MMWQPQRGKQKRKLESRLFLQLKGENLSNRPNALSRIRGVTSADDRVAFDASGQNCFHFLEHPFVIRGVKVTVVSVKAALENALEQTRTLPAHHGITCDRLKIPVR